MLESEPLTDPQGIRISTNRVWLPPELLDYDSRVGAISLPETATLPKDTTFGRRFYRAPDGFAIQVNAVLMGRDRSSIHKPKYCLSGQGWKILREESDEIRVTPARASGIPVQVVIARGMQRLADGQEVELSAIYVYWFVERELVTEDHNVRMWWMARSLATKWILQRWAYLSCFSVCYPGQEEQTLARVKQFMTALVPKVHAETVEMVVFDPVEVK